MTLALHELAEAGHRILDPFSPAKLRLLGEICRADTSTRVLDLACGRGELLATWAAQFGVHGTGVDISTVFAPAAEARAAELGVADRVAIVRADAATYDAGGPHYDIACCLGATWIGDGPRGTVALLRRALRDGGVLAVGEPYWRRPPTPEQLAARHIDTEEWTSLAGTVERLTADGGELVECVLASEDDWDRYEASQWWTLSAWLRANPDDERWPAVRAFLYDSRAAHLACRDALGWGVFVLR